MSQIVKTIQDISGNVIELPIPIDCGDDATLDDMLVIIARELGELANFQNIDCTVPLVNAVSNYIGKYSNSAAEIYPWQILLIAIQVLCKKLNARVSTDTSTDSNEEAP